MIKLEDLQPNARLNSDEARKRADALQSRLQKRMEELKLEKQIVPLHPVALGGLLVVPAGLLVAMRGEVTAKTSTGTPDTQSPAAQARVIVKFDDAAHRVHYVRHPFQREPDFGVTSVNYDLPELLARAERPR